MTYDYHSNGKLLLTGEYVVLDGAKALAIPTKFGQSLQITPTENPQIEWLSLNHEGEKWIESKFQIKDFSEFQLEIIETNNADLSEKLIPIFQCLNELNPSLFKKHSGYEMVSQLEFPKNWGLGSSSTLINNLANWANVDPYLVLEHTFGGSGYDIACAKSDSSLIYQLQPDSIPKRFAKDVNFNPSFTEHLYFVHLNQKQNSREGISRYKSLGNVTRNIISEVSDLSQKFIECQSLEDFKYLLKYHESIITKLIEMKPIQEKLFPDFNGQVKSLGAWGGDFILVASENEIQSYFNDKGYNTIIPYKDMILG